MNKEEAYLNILRGKNWLDRMQSKLNTLKSYANEVALCIESAKKDLTYSEEYLKQFQPKKEMEKEAKDE